MPVRISARSLFLSRSTLTGVPTFRLPDFETSKHCARCRGFGMGTRKLYTTRFTRATLGIGSNLHVISVTVGRNACYVADMTIHELAAKVKVLDRIPWRSAAFYHVFNLPSPCRIRQRLCNCLRRRYSPNIEGPFRRRT
jgi:hypothetical protein